MTDIRAQAIEELEQEYRYYRLELDDLFNGPIVDFYVYARNRDEIEEEYSLAILYHHGTEQEREQIIETKMNILTNCIENENGQNTCSTSSSEYDDTETASTHSSNGIV